MVTAGGEDEDEDDEELGGRRTGEGCATWCNMVLNDVLRAHVGVTRRLRGMILLQSTDCSGGPGATGCQ
jgi:hypothetical protein